MEDIDKFIADEVNQSTQKIKNLIDLGLQEAYCACKPEECFPSEPHQISLDPFFEKAKETEKDFTEILTTIMEQRHLPQFLFKVLEDKKLDTALLLDQYDYIIYELSKNLTECDKEYKRKCEKHGVQHQHLQERIENLISEVTRIGKEEISRLRVSIIKKTSIKVDDALEKCKKSIDESAADVPFDDFLWKPPTSMLPFQDLVKAFSVPQNGIIDLREDRLSEICEFQRNFECEKLSCTLKLESLERELFEIQEKFKKRKLMFAKMKRKQYLLVAMRDSLSKELTSVSENIEKELRHQQKAFKKHSEAKKVINLLHLQENKKYNTIWKEKCTEAFDLLSAITNDLEFVFENVLEIITPQICSLSSLEKFCSSYADEKYWIEILNAAPQLSLIDNILKAVEIHWKFSTALSDCMIMKRSLQAENKELQKLLKYYLFFKQ